MATPRRMRFVRGQLAWMVATVLLLSVFGSLSAELFFTCSLIGLLVVTELTVPGNVTPRWRSRLRWLTVLGVIGFALLVARRLLAVLPLEVIP
ncbi:MULTISPECIES: hypothetical protein [Natrinema]|uniref:Uncharacterized protein n=1 Tax=Natrinema gari JCM 14663 TaxID=1230459 RepID=L9YY49_9EURY|nr:MULTISPECIES: hypothetical protein [Natrinema]AFO55378.1 hypothetical protein NJ7G_0124 [Natrinema sp. J7-2]ELY78407.1 hypothetical protein C486_13292 [Natrinema gari JCM 14663]